MFKKLMFLVQLVLNLLVFSAVLFAQAVVPDPTSLAPVINPPNPQTNIVISLGDFLNGSVTVYEAMNQALIACQQQHAAKLVIPLGVYRFDDPKILQNGYHVGIGNQSDLIIDGQGSQFIFHF